MDTFGGPGDDGQQTGPMAPNGPRHDSEQTGPMVGVRELRANLAEAVRRAGAGHRTVVTSNGRPVAQLGPLDESSPTLDQLVASGALVAPRRTGAWRAPEAVAVWSGVRIDRALRELRG